MQTSKSNKKNKSIRWIAFPIAMLFAILFSLSNIFLVPLYSVDDWQLFSVIDNELDSGASYVVGEAKKANWPSNITGEEGLSYKYLQQKNKWAGVGYHVYINNNYVRSSFVFEKEQIAASFIESDEWQQDGILNDVSILKGITTSAAADGWDALLTSDKRSNDCVFLPKSMGERLSKTYGIETDALLGQKITLNLSINDAAQTKDLSISGFFDISALKQPFYSAVFGDTFFISSSNVFKSLKGSTLLFQFDNDSPKQKYRYNFFEYLENNVFRKNYSVDFSLTPDETVKSKISKTYQTIINYPIAQKIGFFSAHLLLSLSFLIGLFFSLAAAFLYNLLASHKHLLLIASPLCLFLLFWLFILWTKSKYLTSALGISIAMENKTILAIQFWWTFFGALLTCLLLFFLKSSNKQGFSGNVYNEKKITKK